MSNNEKIIGNKNNVKKQHVVPNFLLKNFANNNKIFQFDIKKYQEMLKNGKTQNFYCSKKTDKAIGTDEEKFYDINLNSEKKSSEDLLSEIENKSSKIIKTIIENKSLDNIDIDIDILKKFFVMMFLRSHLVKSSSNNDVIGLDQYNKLQNIEEEMKKYNRAYLFLKEYNSGDLFIGDVPVILYDGYNIPSALWVLPISNNFLLIFSSNLRDFKIDKFKYSVENLNLEQVKYASEFIYMKDNNKKIIDLFNQCKNPNFTKNMNIFLNDLPTKEEKEFFTNIYYEIIHVYSKNNKLIILYLDERIKKAHSYIDNLKKLKSIFKDLQ